MSMPPPLPKLEDDPVLTASLEVAVPMWIDQVARTYPTADGRMERAKWCAQMVAEHGDDILFRGGKRGATAAAFNALAEGLAICAYQPGGVTFAGHHWCTDHAACLAAEAAT